MDIYDLFDRFQLDSLSTEWIQCLWKNDFSEAVEFPVEYDLFSNNLAIEDLMSTASQFIKDWLIREDHTNDTLTELTSPSSTALNRSSLNSSHLNSKSWQTLISNNVQHKAMVSLLSAFILRGKNEKSFEDKLKGLIATNLYLILLAIPGSQVYHIFNPILYSHAMENLKICSSLNSNKSKGKPTSKKGRGDDFEDEDKENNGSDEEGEYAPSDKPKLLKVLSEVLNNLMFTLKRFHLKGQNDSLLITIQILILLTRTERESTALFSSKSPKQNTTTYIASKAYKILLVLCNSDHGEIQETVLNVVKEIMPAFLLFGHKELKWVHNEALVIKEHSKNFVEYLLKHLEDSAFYGVYNLVKNICFRIPDKADLRAKGVQVVMDLLNILPYTLYSHVVVWIMGLCHSDQVKYRVTGLEIVTKLIYGNQRTPTSPLRRFQTGEAANHMLNGHDSEDEDVNDLILTQHPDFSTHKFLIGTIFSMCKDVSASVRAKALSILANLICSNNKLVQYEMESIFVTPYLNMESIENSNHLEKGFFQYHHFLQNIEKETNPNVDPLPGAKAVANLVKVFTEDDKVFVRKSALQTLANIFIINKKWISKKLLQVMVDNCCDKSVSVRKLLVQCLTDILVHYPRHPELSNYWARSVVPLLGDQEIKSQEKVLEALQTTILDNIVPYGQMKSDLHFLPWALLNVIADISKGPLLLFACHKWKLNNTLRQCLITTLQTHIGTENNRSVWFLLSSISQHIDIKDPMFVLEYFYEHVLNKQQVDESCCQMVTEVVFYSWKQLPTVNQINLCDKLLRNLSQFTVPLPMVARCLDICHLITITLADSYEQGRSRIKEWACKLILICESQLEKVVGCDSNELVEDEIRLSQYIFTIGDVAQIMPGHIKHTTLLLIQNLVVDDTYFNKIEDDVAGSRWKGNVSASVKAVVVTALGKLSLQTESTATEFVPLFGSLLNYTSHPEIKINAMIALTDICIKFTSLVENYLSEMCICLKDRNLEVRANTLTLLIQLIQEDYLKLRCPLFFHILTMLNDEEQMIQQMTSSFIVNSLLAKQKNALSQHFVESLFHYNSYLGHSTYSKVGLMTSRERVVFSLEGYEREVQRRNIYRFMLENMMDEDKLKTTLRLSVDILNGVTEGQIELTNSGTALLQDALFVLTSDELQSSQNRASSKDDGDDDVCNEEMRQFQNDAFNHYQKSVFSTAARTNLVTNVVPIIINLKHKLIQLKSPLTRDLMACLRELMKDYKTEINEILAADKELAAEIALDLKKLSTDDEEDNPNENGGNGSVLTSERGVRNINISILSKQNCESPRLSIKLTMPLSEYHKSNKSKAAEKSMNMTANETLNTSNIVSPSSTRVSLSNKGSPSSISIKLSPVTIKISPGSNRVSPDSNKVSPTSNKSSPKEKSLSQNLIFPSETETSEEQCSPSHTIQQPASSTLQINEEGDKQPRSLSSGSSSSSGSRGQSRNKKPATKRNNKK